ncbi:MAG: hypothetical protein K2N65_04660, partial [Anaeroplasmataceae bacterium]|nr:hypothetical protein [Anaeroplasmataceae bacterium]
VRPIINNPDSGLIDGHLFNGTIQTKDVIADEYIGESGFEWQNGYSIYSGPNDVTNNYSLIYNIDAKISKKKLNVTVSPITVPYDNSPHYLIINWGDRDSIILPSNLTDVEQAILYADDNNGDAGLSNFTNVRSSRTIQGTTKVNIRIELPNYEVFQTSAFITILPNKSGLKLTYWPGKLEHLVYNGYQYPEDEIKYTLDVEPGRLVTFKYYEIMEDGTERELTDRPIEVGRYYVIGHVAAGVEGDEEDSAKYPFEIIQRPKRIEWKGDTHSTDEDGNIVDAMIFRGADVEVKPDAFFKDVFDNDVPMKVKFVDAQGKDKTYDSFSIGYYYVKAELDPDHPNYAQYEKNYKFSNDLIVFKIIGAIAGGETGGGNGGDDDPDPNYTGLKFKDPQGDGRSQEDEAYEAQALLDDGKLYITAFKYYTDKPTETIVYTVDLDSGDVLEINGEAVTSDTDMSFHFIIPKNEAGKPDIKTLVNEEATFEIKAQLKDKINTAWSNKVDEDGKADVDDKSIKIKIKPTKLDPTHTTHDPYPEPDGTDVPDIILDPYPTTFLWEGEKITFPLTIHVTHGTVDTSDDDYLVEDVDYTVDWFKNDAPTGATPDSLASFIVTSIKGRIYEFAFGDINYPDDNTKHGGTFTILSTTGDRIEIKETAPHYRFAYYQADMDNNTLAVKVLDVKRLTPLETDVTRDDLLDAEEAESTAQEELRKSIYMINVYQGHRVADLLENLANLPEDIVITANVLDETTGTYVSAVVYDEKQDPAIQDMSTLITTGTRVSLYKHGADHTSGNEIDAVEIMIKGDINGDGLINVSDLTSAYEYISFTSPRDPSSVYYLASLVQTEAISEEVPATPHINVATISALNNHIKGVLDANARGDDDNPDDINLSCKKHSIYDVSGSNSEN